MGWSLQIIKNYLSMSLEGSYKSIGFQVKLFKRGIQLSINNIIVITCMVMKIQG